MNAPPNRDDQQGTGAGRPEASQQGMQGDYRPQQGGPQQGSRDPHPGQSQQYSGLESQQGGFSEAGQSRDPYRTGANQQETGSSRPGAQRGQPSMSGGDGPFEMLRRLDQDMDRLFREFMGRTWSSWRGRGAGAPGLWMPEMEVCEQGGKLHVYADLPGLRKEDVKLSIEGDQLILQGERRSSTEEGQQGRGFYHTERSYGSFYRSVPLPEGVDSQTAQASFKDGVLDVSFDAPRGQQRQSRQVEIRDANDTSPKAGA